MTIQMNITFYMPIVISLHYTIISYFYVWNNIDHIDSTTSVFITKIELIIIDFKKFLHNFWLKSPEYFTLIETY